MATSIREFLAYPESVNFYESSRNLIPETGS